jgi:uncharacterized membrane protein
MRMAYLLSVYLHILAALIWLGGMLFLGLVGAPVLRAIEPTALRQRLFNDLGLRFRTVGWIAILVLVITGVTNLYFKGWINLLGTTTFWRSDAGSTLAIKLGAVLVMLLISAIHDFRLGPAAGRLEAGSAEAIAFRVRAARLARLNALVGLILLLAAVRLARGI